MQISTGSGRIVMPLVLLVAIGWIIVASLPRNPGEEDSHLTDRNSSPDLAEPFVDQHGNRDHSSDLSGQSSQETEQGLVCRLGEEIDLEKVWAQAPEPTPEERERSESLPRDEVYRRFQTAGLDWEALHQLKSGDLVVFPLPGGLSASGIVNLVQTRPGEPFGIAGNLFSGIQGTFSLVQDPLVGVRGFLLPANGEKAYRFKEESGEVFFDEVNIGSILCHGMPKGFEERGPVRMVGAVNPAVPLLQSRPGALGVLYIDLDGEVVTDPSWNGGQTINATPPVFSSQDTIRKIWQEVSEAYSPFSINVTTDVAVYNGATPGRRMRIIVTSNNWYGSGGVAMLSSFQSSGTTPCWAFNGASNLDANTHLAAMTISHEFGHTFGLWHDGLLPADPNSNDVGAYYQGHLTPVGGWGPIMGAPFPVDSRYIFPIRPIVQWSQGDYEGTNASSVNIFTHGNNPQNDLAIIAGPLNQVGYNADDFADSAVGASVIPQSPSNSGTILLTNGLIHTDNDADVFQINLLAGMLQVVASNAPISPTLKLRLALINPDQMTTNTISDPVNRMTASISTNLPDGIYYLRVEGVGTTTNTNTTNGFIGYGSIGQYTLSGSFRNVPHPMGDFFASPITITGNPFSVTNDVRGADAEPKESGYVTGRARTTTWYSWVSPGFGQMSVDTRGSGFDTTLAVCTPAPGKSNTLANLVLVAANNNADSQTNASAVRFGATSGLTYYFQVDSANGVLSNGVVVLNGAGSLSPEILNNDNFASAFQLPPLSSFSTNGSLLAATAQPNEPALAGLAATRSVWFRWLSPAKGKLTLSTRGSDCDTVLGVYTGTVTGADWTNLRLLAGNDNISASMTASELGLTVSNGIQYWMKIDSRRSASGSYVLDGFLQPSPELVAPTGLEFALKAANGSNYQPLVAWSNVVGALSYEVGIFKGTNRVSRINTTNLSWTNGPVFLVTNTNFSLYKAQVRACSNNLYSPWSALVPATEK